MGKRASNTPEAPAKRQAPASAEDASEDELEPVDLQGVETMESEEPFEATVEMFPEGTTQDQVDSFNKAYAEFTQGLEEQEEMVVVVGDPCKIRPIPQSVGDFRDRMVHFELTPYGNSISAELEDKMMLAQLESDADQLDEAGLKRMRRNQLKVVEDIVAMGTARMKTDTPKAFEIAVVMGHALTDFDKCHDAFKDGWYAAEGKQVLGELSSLFRDVLADKQLELSDRTRRHFHGLAEMVVRTYDRMADGCYKDAFKLP